MNETEGKKTTIRRFLEATSIVFFNCAAEFWTLLNFRLIIRKR